MSFPTIHISCPCSDAPSASRRATAGSLLSKEHPDVGSDDLTDVDDDGQSNFNPYNQRANFSLYPLDRLLFCEDCNQIRCPRCIQDEIVCYFCPSCLFEVPSNAVKSEGNRCTRNCYSCPICFASLSATALGDDGSPPFILLCNHCLWSSSEIGIELEKTTSITAQLSAKFKPRSTTDAPEARGSDDTPDSQITTPISSLGAGSASYFPSSTARPPPPEDGELSPDDLFVRLKDFYNEQKSSLETDEYGHGGFSRLISLYSASGGRMRGYNSVLSRTSGGGKAKQDWSEYEYVQVNKPESELAEISEISSSGFSGSTSLTQRLNQPYSPHLLSELRPVAALLRTKRSKRCRTCRHILYKPESKIGSIRCRIRLVAMNYIPTLSITRFDPTSVSYHNLVSLNSHLFLLTVTNPLYDAISVHLATPERSPGKHPSTVTIYCPEFNVGANADVWDEALASASGHPSSGGHRAKPRDKKSAVPGQIWDRGRNWTSVIIEITPPAIQDDVDEKERVVKVPIFVRCEYDTEVERDDGDIGKGVKEKKEYAFWSSIDVGRIGKKEPEGPQRPHSLFVGSSMGDRERRAERAKRSSVR